MNKTHYIRNVKKPELVNMYLKLLESDDKKRIKELEEQNKELNIQNANLNNDIKLLKDTSVDRGEAQRLEGKIKKRDHIIKELESQIDSTKINALTHLENTIHKQNEQIKYLKAGYGKFDLDENTQLKKDIEYLKQEHGELIKKLDKIQNGITLLYDDF